MVNSKANSPNTGPYTPQYKTITQVGHTRPTQEIGAPTLVWHVAVWPRRHDDPQGVKPQVEEIDVASLLKKRRSAYLLKAGQLYELAIKAHNQKREDIVGDPTDKGLRTLNGLLRHLKELGRTPDSNDEPRKKTDRLELKVIAGEDETKSEVTNEEKLLKFTDPESIGFTLWWRDRIGGMSDQHATAMPGYDPLRVRVQVETQIDYFAITFLIDVGNPWNIGQVFSSSEAPGERRRKVFTYVEQVREKGDIAQSVPKPYM